MRTRDLLFVTLLAAITACSNDPTLEGAFKRDMKADGVSGFDILHIEQTGDIGLVLHTSWTDEYPENRNTPALSFYQHEGEAWQRRPGTNCSANGMARLSLLGNGYVFCSVLRDGWNFDRIRVGDTEANIFEFGDGKRVWYAVTDDWEAKVVGVAADGRESELN